MNAPRKRKKSPKFIFVTGGVISSLGKGIAAASLGMLLKQHGFRVTIQKFDPYINVDPGTMSPYQHGEVFVTDDGAETDLDLGHYERFIDVNMTAKNSHTTGKVYKAVIDRERRGDYLGATVQVIPHITDEIKERIQSLKSDNYDIIITEIGGTVGDIESLPFLEAIRQFCLDNPRDTMKIHVTLVPFIRAADELKTKPTQHSVMKLREIGIQPDILLCRSERPLSKEMRAKIGLFCNVPSDAVIEASDVRSIYEVPLIMLNNGLDHFVLRKLNLRSKGLEVAAWKNLVNKVYNAQQMTRIAVCGKYTGLPDAYKSIIESFIHAGVENNTKVEIQWMDSSKIDEHSDLKQVFAGIDGILVPGGFGERGIEGMILAVKYAREHRIPFFGICLGMQCMSIEFGRHVCGLNGANSSEFNKKTKFPVIDLMEHQRQVTEKGATMRLGAYPCVVKEKTRAFTAYGKDLISERHRHRFEFNNRFIETFEQHGMIFSGLSPDYKLVEIVELKDHPWFLGVQFHPELKSRAIKAHPLFREFVKAALHFQKSRPGGNGHKHEKKPAVIV